MASSPPTTTKTIVITRFDPDKDEAPRKQEYQVPCEDNWKVLDAVNFIKDEIRRDRVPSLVLPDGRLRLLRDDGERRAEAHLQDLDQGVRGERVDIEPLANFPVVRDLVVELDGFMHKFESVKPWIKRVKEKAEDKGALHPKKLTYTQSAEELATFKQFSMCINCMLCYSACPVVANEPEFLGPAAIALGPSLQPRHPGRGDRGAPRDLPRRGDGLQLLLRQRVLPRSAPKNVDPAAAVNQAKFGAVIDWAKGLVLPRAPRAAD